VVTEKSGDSVVVLKRITTNEMRDLWKLWFWSRSFSKEFAAFMARSVEISVGKVTY
jgi:hypothetical protein